MWHEARRQEKKIRGMLVDYRKRADRRKEFYEKIVSFFQDSLIIQKDTENYLILSESRSKSISSSPWSQMQNSL